MAEPIVNRLAADPINRVLDRGSDNPRAGRATAIRQSSHLQHLVLGCCYTTATTTIVSIFHREFSTQANYGVSKYVTSV